MHVSLTLALVLAPASAAQPSGGAPSYTMRILEAPDGRSADPFPELTVGGRVSVNYDNVPYVHEPDGSLRRLESNHSVEGMNDAGFAVGGDLFRRPVAWRPSGTFLRLPTPPGLNDGFAHAISESNVVVGRVKDAADIFRAVLWLPGQAPVVLPDLGSTAGAYAVSEQGHVAGFAWSVQGRFGLYFDGTSSTFVPFGLGGATFETINDVGQAAGRAHSSVPGFPGYVGQQAFVYDHTTNVTRGIGFVSAHGYFTSAHGLNNAGDVVGFSLRQPPGESPISGGFVSEASGLHDLNDVVVDLPPAARIVTGWAIDDGGRILVELRLDPASNRRTLAILTRV